MKKHAKRVKVYFLPIFGILSLFFIYLAASSHFYQPSHPVPIHYKYIAARSLFPTPTPTPSPTPIPTPTPAGYCLLVPVLFYHHIQPWADALTRGQTSLTVDPSVFDGQMAYLVSRGYTSITAEQLVNALRTHTGLAPRSVVITFDDGYEDNFTNAFPILQKYHLLGNIMVATGLLGGQGNNTYFSWGELKQMVGNGTISAYDHTWSHYSTGTGNPTKDQYEIMTAKSQLESNLGKPVDIFTYPYGSGQTNASLIVLLQRDGFVGAFSTIGGSLQCDSYIFTLRRTRIGNVPLSSYGF